MGLNAALGTVIVFKITLGLSAENDSGGTVRSESSPVAFTFMYIVAIAWLYVTVLMALAQDSVLSGLGTVLFYGIIPCVVLMYVLGAPQRARRRKQAIQSLPESVQESNTDATAKRAANVTVTNDA